MIAPRWDEEQTKLIRNTVLDVDGLQILTNDFDKECIKVTDPSAVKTFFQKLPPFISQVGYMVGNKKLTSPTPNWYLSFAYCSNCLVTSPNSRIIIPSLLTGKERQMIAYHLREQITQKTGVTIHSPTDSTTKKNNGEIKLSIEQPTTEISELDVLLKAITHTSRYIGAFCQYFESIEPPSEPHFDEYTTYSIIFKTGPTIKLSNKDYIRKHWIYQKYKKLEFECPNCSEILTSDSHDFICDNCCYIINSNPSDISSKLPETPTSKQIYNTTSNYLQEQQKQIQFEYGSQLNQINNSEDNLVTLYSNIPDFLGFKSDTLWVDPHKEKTPIYFYDLRKQQFTKQTIAHYKPCSYCTADGSDRYLQGAYYVKQTGFSLKELALCKQCYDELTNHILEIIRSDAPEYIVKIL